MVKHPFRSFSAIRAQCLFWLCTALMGGCSASDTTLAQRANNRPDAHGSYSVGNTTIRLNDPSRERQLVIEAWYPSDHDGTRTSDVSSFESADADRVELAEIYEAAPATCPTRNTQSLRDGALVATAAPLPVVLFSHCFNCGRYSSFSLNERLASHGMLVLSVDHAGSLPFLADAQGETLSPAQLEERVSDLRFVLNAVKDGQLFELSNALTNAQVDPQRIGIYGHSFGAVTAGTFAMDEPGVQAVAGLAAPMASPLFPITNIKAIGAPILLILAEEDNSIQEVGNRFIRNNFEEAESPAWLIELQDAGHWSVSDLCGLTETFMPGCGVGTRHSPRDPGAMFSYMSVRDGISITQNYLTAFFLGQLMEIEEAKGYLEQAPDDARVSISHKP